MTSTDPHMAALNARAEEQADWRKELMALVKKPKLTKAEIARLQELNKRQIASKGR